jgi:hypothetical protein
MSKTDVVGIRLAKAADRYKIWPLARAFATTYELDQGGYTPLSSSWWLNPTPY